jgi:hypothetical protein
LYGKGVAEGLTDNDIARTAYMYGLKHGREGVGNNMDRAKAEWGDNFKHYNAGFLKGRNEKSKGLKAAGQGYGRKQQGVAEGWSQKYKKSINCSHPKGFSQKAHCAGKKKHNESIEMEMTCPDCGMCETHGDHSRNTLDEACWKGYHKEGNKKMFGKTYPNCVKNTNEEQELDENLHKWFKEKWVRFGPDGKIRGDCARGDDSEGKPKCLPQSKAHSLGKKGRASAAARKRREDPNPERSGKAINVNTKKKSNEDITEISNVTKQSYKQQAQQQVKDLKPHAEKGEYKDIAQRAIDRRERGLKRLGK